jgi:hypothetical protein
VTIYWMGFKCRDCGTPVSEQSADLYINPEQIIAIHKNIMICRELQVIKAKDNGNAIG